MLSALLLALAVAAGPAEAEQDLAEALKHLRAFRETRALDALKRAKTHAASSPELLARAHLLTGLAHAQLAQKKEALEAFSSAVKLDRDIAPSEEDTSPKVLEWFNEVRANQGLPPLGEELAKKPEVERPPEKPPEPKIIYVEKEAPPPPPPPKSRAGLYVGLGALGLGAIAGGVGLLYGMRANNLSDHSKAQTHVDAHVDLNSQAVTHSRVANIAWVTGGLLAIGGSVVLMGEF